MSHLPVSGVSSGKRVVAEIGFKVVRRRELIVAVLGLGVSGVCPVVDGGGMVANRRRGDGMLLCWIGVSVVSGCMFQCASGHNGWVTHRPC